jgi:ABC-type metal ion transport system, periplasmic component/surface adhesin
MAASSASGIETGVVGDMTHAARRKRIRKRRALAAALLAAAMLLAGCGADGAGGSNGIDGAGGNGGGGRSDGGRLGVVTSFYPLFFLASEIGGDRVNVANLVPAGVEPHDWTPKSRDLARISQADLFLHTGAGFEAWTDELLDGIDAKSGVMIVEASEGIELIPLDAEAGSDEHNHEEKDDHGQEEADGHEPHGHGPHGHGGSFDPHVWVSPKSMLQMARNVRDAFAAADSAGAAAFEENYRALAGRLEALDQAYERELAGLPRRDIVVSHQAFAYLCRDYGLNQIAVMGLTPEAEPKAQDLKRIVDFVRENGIRYIFFEELVSDRLARMLASEAGAETLVLNPVEGLTPEQEANGDDYVTIMEMNLQNLKKALQ